MIELLTVDGKLFSASYIVQSTASNTCKAADLDAPLNSDLEATLELSGTLKIN